MDRVVAERMVAELTGVTIAGWLIESAVGFGKSAIVFKATKGGSTAAVKIFDREMVERFGKAAQLERVQRERQLVGKYHPNLIQILDAGEDTAHGLFFVVMEYLPGKNLAQVLVEIPIANIQPLIAQVACAAQFLESLNLAHRDIKPENIGVSDDFANATLLDLGVIRPIGLGNITDDKDQKSFIATLQYSPPELLIREELDTIEGWRAVTFYQLGGVLHDLLTRRPLFAQYLAPYGKLVEAVRHLVPTINAPSAPADLRLLAQNCLVKNPQARLALISWDSFQKSPAPSGSVAAAAERIAKRRQATTAQPPLPNAADKSGETRSLLESLKNLLASLLRDICQSDDAFPPRRIEHFDADSVVTVQVAFAASKAKALSCRLVLRFHGSVLDVESKVVCVSLSAQLASTGSETELASGEIAKVIFEGALVPDILGEQLRNYLILALDAGQDAAGRAPDKVSTWLEFAALEEEA